MKWRRKDAGSKATAMNREEWTKLLKEAKSLCEL
jgi:hypothetical protein